LIELVNASFAAEKARENASAMDAGFVGCEIDSLIVPWLEIVGAGVPDLHAARTVSPSGR
jgi:hypothetical protein